MGCKWPNGNVCGDGSDPQRGSREPETDGAWNDARGLAACAAADNNPVMAHEAVLQVRVTHLSTLLRLHDDRINELARLLHEAQEAAAKVKGAMRNINREIALHRLNHPLREQRQPRHDYS